VTTAAGRRPLGGLLAAYLISVLGTSMSALAIPWLVLTTTGSAAQTGLVAFAEMAPYVALQALAGPLVDRVGARRACVLGNLAAAVAVCAIPGLYAIGALHLGALAGLVAIAGAVRGVADCANSVLVPGAATLGSVPLERAAGLASSANQAGLLIGAPLAGVLVTLAGSPVVVLIDGLTFAVAGLLIGALVPVAAQPEAPDERRMSLRRYATDLADGLRFIRGDRLMLVLMTMIAVTNLIEQGLSAVLLPVWVRDHLHRPEALGLITGVLGVGMLLGSLAGAWAGPRLPRRTTYALGFLIAGAPPFVALALSSTLPPVLTILLIGGLAGGTLNPILGALQYERIPPHLRARVLGAVKASAWIGIPFGSLLAGALADTVGLRTTLLAMGAAILIATLAPVPLPAMRGMNRMPRPETEPRSAAQNSPAAAG
jgi:MFS family permease